MEGGAEDPAMFRLGLEAAGGEGGLLHQLFSVRTLCLFGDLAPARAASYLSGILIGNELRELAPPSAPVHVIGSERLTSLYLSALRHGGITGVPHAETASAAGMHRLAAARGLTGAAPTGEFC